MEGEEEVHKHLAAMEDEGEVAIDEPIAALEEGGRRKKSTHLADVEEGRDGSNPHTVCRRGRGRG